MRLLLPLAPIGNPELWLLATLAVANLAGPLECDRQKVRLISAQVFPTFPIVFYGLFMRWTREIDPKDLAHVPFARLNL